MTRLQQEVLIKEHNKITEEHEKKMEKAKKQSQVKKHATRGRRGRR